MHQAHADMPAASLAFKPEKDSGLVRLILGSSMSGMYCLCRQSDAHLNYPFHAMHALFVLTSTTSNIV